MIDDGPWAGVPIGGLGAGSIGRTYRGDFARWHLEPGRHLFESLPACQFSVYVRRGGEASAHVLAPIRPSILRSWNWDMPVGAGTYHGLFPKAWFAYEWPALPVRLVQKQFSPIIPGNYRESSYPVGVFEWLTENPGPSPITLGLMFTWQNLVGHEVGAEALGGHRNTVAEREDLRAIVLAGPEAPSDAGWQGSFAIAAAPTPAVRLSHRARFEIADGVDLWADFASDGRLDDVGDEAPAAPGRPIAAALAATLNLGPGESATIPFVLAWDLPHVEFGAGTRWRRRYTRFFGSSGRAAPEIAAEALVRHADWEAEIDAWQGPILADPSRPDWYKGALFNELYFLLDGGTVWEDGLAADAPADGSGRFGLLECFDYPFHNTLDVNFYASWALALLWPELERRVIRDFGATVALADPEVRRIAGSGQPAARKIAGALPHDVGGPAEDPFLRLNSYDFQDPNTWKDLNAKFVLQLWRDRVLLDDPGLVREAWPAVVQALEYLAAFDRDGDGLPEHDGVPDQTYDTWTMRGPSAYGGGLWLAALRAAVEMARLLGDGPIAERFGGLLRRGLAAFEERLWAAGYYRYDASGGRSSDSIMADQLAGQWYADAAGLEAIAEPERVEAALRTIYRLNVLGFADGAMGAVNGIRPDGTVDRSSEQSQEVWVGTTYALAAFMLGRGLTEEGWRTAWGAARVTYETGYWFRTPEAYDRDGNYRASLYLRPLSIWAIEHALRSRPSRSRT